MWLLVKVANEIMTCGMKGCLGLTKHKTKIDFAYGNSIFNSKVDKMLLSFLVSKRYSFFNHEAGCK